MVGEFEHSILEILRDDARTDMAHIAAMTGKDESAVRSAVARLENEKVIVKYPALINWDKVDVDEVEALIEVRVTPQRDEGFDAIAEQIYKFDEVSSVYLMSGAYDLMVLVKARSMKRLALFVAEKLSTLDNVLSTATHFVLKKYKSDGVVFEDEPVDDRLVVSP